MTTLLNMRTPHEETTSKLRVNTQYSSKIILNGTFILALVVNRT